MRRSILLGCLLLGLVMARYDFKRSEEDQSTVKLVYENRGEKLGIARLDLNDRIAAKIEEAELDPDQQSLLEKLLGKDYEVITADDRLDKLADDFVEYCSTRWQTGKSMLVCIDKITCARMYQRIIPRWKTKADIGHCSSGDPASSQTNISCHLHGRCPGYCLAKRHACTKCFVVKPVLLLHSHPVNISNHGRPSKGSCT